MRIVVSVQNGQKRIEKEKEITNFMCHMSVVTFRVSPVTNANSQSATATATDRPPANSPTYHSRLVHKDKKGQKLHETAKNKNV